MNSICAPEPESAEHAGDAAAETAECLQQLKQIPDVPLRQLNVHGQQALVDTLTVWQIQPNGTEGYRTAEMTFGGVETNELSSRTNGIAPRAGSLFYR